MYLQVYWNTLTQRQWIGSALVQIMACRLVGAKPLSKLMLDYLSIGLLGTNFSEILIKIQTFSLTKMHLKLSSAKWCPFCRVGELGKAWWRHQMETFPLYWPFVRGIFGPGEFPSQRPMTRSFDVFFDLRLNKRLSKQLWSWWFETLSSPLWRHSNGVKISLSTKESNQIHLV